MPQSRQHKPRLHHACSPARLAALTVLESVLSEGKTLLDTISRLETLCPDERDLALARDIVSGTCRWWGRLRHILLHAAPRLGDFPPTVQRILEMSVYQILYLDRVPDYAVLSEAVELARKHRFSGLAPAVNGILRTVTRTQNEIPFPEPESHFTAWLASVHSHPRWLVERWLNIWPKENVQSLCEFNNTQAPLSLRTRIGCEAALQELRSAGIDARADERIPGRLILEGDFRLPRQLFANPHWAVQDGAAMLVAPLVNAQPGWCIWDVCAAPGGKTRHLADMTDNQAYILASDRSRERLQSLSEQIQRDDRRGVTVREIDALQKRLPLESEAFDAILVDAPCSGWGTFRRHPDLRWRLQSQDMKKFGRQALQILENVQPYLKNGGVLVYGTCTLSPEENERIVASFLERHPEYRIETVKPFLPPGMHDAVTPEGFLSIFPPAWNMDGAFAARLRKGFEGKG